MAWNLSRKQATGEPPATLVLYTRRRCHLCDVAKATLEELAAEVAFVVEERDVDDDPTWKARYGEQVPVGVLDGLKVFKYRIDKDKLRTALRRRA